MSPRYPPISDTSLVPVRAVQALLKNHPDALDQQDCPYSPSIRAFLRELFAIRAEAVEVYDDDELGIEIVRLYKEVQRMQASSDPKEAAQIAKTKAGLLEKMLEMRERQINVRNMAKFQKVVVETMETILTPAQRSDFTEKLANVL